MWRPPKNERQTSANRLQFGYRLMLSVRHSKEDTIGQLKVTIKQPHPLQAQRVRKMKLLFSSIVSLRIHREVIPHQTGSIQ